jgi:MFS family permease
MTDNSHSKYRWYVLALGTITHIFVFAMPRMCMPVLFAEISRDLGLDLVQVGTVWGMLGLASLCTGFLFGLVTDRFGSRLTLGVVCILQGLAGTLRGVAGDFTSLAAFMFLFGFFCVPLSFATHKAAGEWFSGKQLGLANGILAMGIGVGTTLSTMVSATVLSPLVGGWRHLMFVFGAVAVVVGLLWLGVRRRSDREGAASAAATVPFRQALSHVTRLRAVWFLVLAQMCIVGARMGLSGYLPLHLRAVGWPEVSADGALATLSAVSVISVIPLSLLSDKLGLRKAIMMPSLLITLTGVGMLAFSSGPVVWLSVVMIGVVQEALAAVYITLMMETEGIGTAYAGTALGLSTTIAGIGNFLAPPLGNRLAEINPSFAFIFWAAMLAVSFIIYFFIRETGWRQKSAAH